MITVRGVKCLEMADVVIYDRLVNPEILRYANEKAELHYAGKSPGDGSSQEEITELTISEALKGKVVVRLRGSNPFLFARGAEEALALALGSCPDKSPKTRMRRLRKSEVLRKLVRETAVSPDDLIYPMFVTHGSAVKEDVPSMPGVFRYSTEMLTPVLKEVWNRLGNAHRHKAGGGGYYIDLLCLGGGKVDSTRGLGF